MIQLPCFDEHRQRYAGLSHTGLRISCAVLNQRVVGFDPVFFGNVLAYAVMKEATDGRGLPDEMRDLYDIPLPLAKLWQDDEGKPLWAASCLLPVGEWEEDRDYLHKRKQTGRFTYNKKGVFSIDPQRGRWMERRYVVKSTVCPEFEAFVIGNAKEIARLLERIHHVGKFRTAGYGDVGEWRIEPVPLVPVDVLVRDGVCIHPVPVAAAETLGIETTAMPGFAGWTPPYWHGASMADAWRCGTRIEEVAV